jgi:hypothetical protein
MNPKLLLCLALVLSGGLLCCRIEAQNFLKTNEWPGFPTFSPITNADPTILHQISIRVPTKLKIERTTDTLSVAIDKNSFESTNLMVGTNMVTGFRAECYVFPIGESRPTNRSRMVQGGVLDFNSFTCVCQPKLDGIPLAGKKYIVEIDLAIFETDIPSQHMWMPESKKYKVIWQRTLKQVVQ